MLGPMQPIIRRTITITITETWTIIWADGHETSWTETREVVSPTVSEADPPLPPLTADLEPSDDLLDSDAADPPAEDE